MSMPRIATRLNHVAYPTFDTAATVRFYTEVLGFRLVDAVREERGPKPFLHTFFAMESGEVIAFFDILGLEKPESDALPPWVRHLALSVDSPEILAAWKRRLEDHGLTVTGPIDHDGVWSSIYFVDPNGVTLELTHQARALNDADAARAADMVARWTAERAGDPAR
jgi:catechol 2,3-dioxygenase-like lactoylglutathione lyase family enzyme